MAQISAAQVKELREKTGAGMMDCKSALTEADGDMEEAVKILRKKGLAAASKKAGRIASEGVIAAYVKDTTAVMVEVNSETDFVAQTAEFREMVDTIARVVAESHPTTADELSSRPYPNDPDGHNVGQVIAGKIAKVGENITLRRFIEYQGGAGAVFGSYIHGGGKIGVLVELVVDNVAQKSAAESIAKDVAMHIAAAEPRFLHRNEVTEKDLDTEKEIAREQALKSGKPEAVVEKIVAGKMEKFYGETVLLEQPYIRDDKQTIAKYIEASAKKAGVKIDVARFTRFKLGEGLQKRSDDFVSEVMAQAGK